MNILLVFTQYLYFANIYILQMQMALMKLFFFYPEFCFKTNFVNFVLFP